MNKEPMISCICVTRKRPALLMRAVGCFLSQSYPSKELVILYEENDPDTEQVISAVAGPLIHPVKVKADPAVKLGELRNRAILLSRGTYFCQWDDDDWYHNDRLRIQYEMLARSRKDACILTNWLLYDEKKKQAWLSYTRLWEGSVLCKKSIVKDVGNYDNLSKGEDTAFVNRLVAGNAVYPLAMASLYIYTHHSSNTWDYAHFLNNIVKQSQPLSGAVSGILSQIVGGSFTNEEASQLLLGDLQREFNYIRALI